MKCPSCKLENPNNATRCDCGYAFVSTSTPAEKGLRAVPTTDPSLSLYLRSIDDSLRTIKCIALAWAVLTVIGAVIWILRR